MSSVINRMLEVADFKGVSANKLAEKIGVGNSYFSQQKKNNGSVGSDIMLHLCSEYPDINPEWLLTGKGNMLRNNVGNVANGNGIIQQTNGKNINATISQHSAEMDVSKKEIQALKKRIKELEADKETFRTLLNKLKK